MDELRKAGRTISFVAEQDGAVVGHILFSPIQVESVPVLALAPMAVMPKFQRRGIGSQLVRAGIEECRKGKHRAIVVVGHPEYYPRFGFRPARSRGILSPFPVKDGAFMVLELAPGPPLRGLVAYPPAFRGI